MAASTLSVVQQWHTTLNANQVDEMVALVHPQVEIVGPRGTTSGAEIVREWFGRANVRLVPQRCFARSNRVVVEELGEWLSPETGQVVGSQVVATAFNVDTDGLITHISRHDTLTAALDDAALTVEDEVETS